MERQEEKKQNKLYIIFAYLCLIDLICLPVRAILLGENTAVYSMPLLICTTYFIIVMARKKLPYEVTFNGANNIPALIIIICCGLSYDMINRNYQIPYNSADFWRNISISSDQYNNLFFFSYNLLVSFILGILLTFNNIDNIRKRYEENKKNMAPRPLPLIENLPSLLMNIGALITIMILHYFCYIAMKEITTNLFYFLSTIVASWALGRAYSTLIINIIDSIVALIKWLFKLIKNIISKIKRIFFYE